MRFDTYAKLNPQGMKEWGDIFEDGYVPIRNIVGQVVRLVGSKKKHVIYMVAHEKLKLDILDKLIYKLSKKFKSSKEEIKIQMINQGLPLREELVSIVGTNGMHLF